MTLTLLIRSRNQTLSQQIQLQALPVVRKPPCLFYGLNVFAGGQGWGKGEGKH